MYLWIWCFLQDFLGGRTLGQDREFRPERETAPGPRQPGVPPVRPHTGNPLPLLTLLSITGLTLPPGCHLHSPALFHSSAHRVTLTGRLSVPQLMLNSFDLIISSTSLPLWPSFFFLPFPVPFFLPSPFSLSVFFLSSLLLPRFPSWSRCPPL